jgi:hypothetical protein
MRRKAMIQQSFHEELEHIYHFSKYHMKIRLGDFNAKLVRDYISKPTIGNDSLHHDRNDNGVRIENSATLKTPAVKSKMLPRRNTHNTLGPLLMGRQPDCSYIDR